MKPKFSTEPSPLVEQLGKILGRLEAEFRDLVQDANALEKGEFAEFEMVAEKLNFAAYCIATAKRVLSDNRVAVLLNGPDEDRLPS